MPTVNKPETSILIVDDDITLLKTMQVWFELKKFNVFIAGGGYEAMKLLENQKVDIILSDVRMPLGNGSELLKWIKDSGLKIPVILMSGFSDLDEAQALKGGAVSLIAKPLDSKRLLALIETLIQK